MYRVLRVCAPLVQQTRALASESKLSDWAMYPDTSKRSQQDAKQLLNATMGSDDSYQPTVIRRTYGTKEDPNLVPMRESSRLIACTCSPTEPDLHYMLLHRHDMIQCPCKQWFKAVHHEQLDFEKLMPSYV